jgi:hypothetical protein
MMKRSILLLLAICLLIGNTANGQKNSLLKKVTKSMTDELLGKPPEGSGNNKSNQPEPACACDKPVVAMDLGGKLQLDYTELAISISDDDRVLAQHRYSKEYYIVKNGVTTGPIKPGDARLKGFPNLEDGSTGNQSKPFQDNQYITPSGEKFIITFGGKTYGPYSQIQNFAVSKSREKFAAVVIENLVVNESQGKKMDEAIKNAKTEQEKMDLAMKYSQEMMQKMQQGGGPESTTPKVITNIPGPTLNPMIQSASFNGNIKYDDILVKAFDKITDVQGKTVVTLKPEFINSEQLFVNTSNTKYASYSYGSISFSDGISLSELFNPHLVKVDGQVYISYMYYSPKKNSIMQCKILF